MGTIITPEQFSATPAPRDTHDTTQKLPVFDQFRVALAIQALDIDFFRETAPTIPGLDFDAMPDFTLLAVLHRARMGLTGATEAQKRISEGWLRFNNLF